MTITMINFVLFFAFVVSCVKADRSGGGGGSGSGSGAFVLFSASDPQFRTYDGSMYSYHGQCDLVLARSTTFGSDLGLDVHGRTEIAPGTEWAFISNAAIRIGDDVLEVTRNGTYYFNGVSDAMLPIFMSGLYEVSKNEDFVDGEGTVRTLFNVDLTNGESITVLIWKNMIGINIKADLVDSEGMFGNSKRVGLIGRDGSTVLTDCNEMGAQWQVHDFEPILFQELRAPQYPERCIVPIASSNNLRHSEDVYKRAEVAWSDIEDEEFQDRCVEDILKADENAAAHSYEAVV